MVEEEIDLKVLIYVSVSLVTIIGLFIVIAWRTNCFKHHFKCSRKKSKAKKGIKINAGPT